MSATTIEEGCRVIIRKGNYLRSEQVRRKTKVSVQKLNFFLDNAIGCSYGTMFKVERNGGLTILNATKNQMKQPFTSGENNQFLNDNGSSQKLTKDAIMDLKAQGYEGEDIIEQLVENSETFEKKTEFSQEKYLNKKRSRHLSQITILKPTLPLVCEMMYSNWPVKILELRMDTVSQILTMANIHSNINVLLLETTQSFLAGAILHRMGGSGNVVQLYNGDFPIRLLLPHFGLSDEETQILSGFPMHKINILHHLESRESLSLEAPTELVEDMDSTVECNEERTQFCDDVGEDSSLGKHEESTNTCLNNERRTRRSKHYLKPLTQEEKHLRKIQRNVEESKALELLKDSSFDCLIIASKFRAKPTLIRLIEFLAPSRPVVVFSEHKEVLNECFMALKERKNVINLDLTETWWRSYQVLTQRTHPHIMMDGAGGYLLTGIKVDHELSTDNSGINPNLVGNRPVNAIDLDPSTKKKTNIKINEVVGTRDLKDNPRIKSDSNLNPDSEEDSLIEPSAKRTKLS